MINYHLVVNVHMKEWIHDDGTWCLHVEVGSSFLGSCVFSPDVKHEDGSDEEE